MFRMWVEDVLNEWPQLSTINSTVDAKKNVYKNVASPTTL